MNKRFNNKIHVLKLAIIGLLSDTPPSQLKSKLEKEIDQLFTILESRKAEIKNFGKSHILNDLELSKEEKNELRKKKTKQPPSRSKLPSFDALIDESLSSKPDFALIMQESIQKEIDPQLIDLQELIKQLKEVITFLSSPQSTEKEEQTEKPKKEKEELSTVTEGVRQDFQTTLNQLLTK